MDCIKRSIWTQYILFCNFPFVLLLLVWNTQLPNNDHVSANYIPTFFVLQTVAVLVHIISEL